MNEFIKRHLWAILIAGMGLAGTWAVVKDRVAIIPQVQADVAILKTFKEVQMNINETMKQGQETTNRKLDKIIDIMLSKK